MDTLRGSNVTQAATQAWHGGNEKIRLRKGITVMEITLKKLLHLV